MKIANKKDPCLCSAYRCRNKRGDKKKFCHKHHAENQKITNPLGYTYNKLHQNAKRRKKDFTLTLDEFREFCETTSYLDKKGKSKRSLTIDRIDSSKGYSRDNIQVLKLIDNSRKGNRDVKNIS